MFEEYEKKKRKDVSIMRSVLDYGMGILIIGAGVIFLFRDKLKIDMMGDTPPTSLDKMFGGICLVYGAWRIYRGVKKNYFR